MWKANIILGYRKDNLSVERKRRLDSIGFVWNWRDFAWERGFAALLKFKRREGHCRVNSLHRETFPTHECRLQATAVKFLASPCSVAINLSWVGVSGASD